MKAICHSQIMVVGLFFFLCACLSARANVYATDIRLNGSPQAGVVVPGSPLKISFILNDVATNVSVQIYAGTNVLKTFSSNAGQFGTNAGLHTVIWDGTNEEGSAAAVGVYNVRITAAAAGYDTWTNFTDDGTNFDVFFPTSIAVNKNTNSPYYGRVFIGNGKAGTLDFTNGGTVSMGNGILKCNADGSPADEGGFGRRKGAGRSHHCHISCAYCGLHTHRVHGRPDRRAVHRVRVHTGWRGSHIRHSSPYALTHDELAVPQEQGRVPQGKTFMLYHNAIR